MSKQDNQNKQQKKGFSLARLFQNNRFVLVFSLATAIVLWFIMAINNTETRGRIIDRVPINISLSDSMKSQGYEIYDTTDTEARISVTGNNLTVNQLSKDDVKVELDTSDITETGYYQLNLTANQNSSKTDYTIDSIYPASLKIFVDKKAEKAFKVETDIQYSAAEGYYASNPVLSVKEITISGADTEVSRVERVVVEKTLDGALKEPVEFEEKVVLYDKDGEKIDSQKHISLSTDTVSAKINVLKKAELALKPIYKNLPSGVDLSSIATIEPETLIIGYPENADVNLETISLSTIDMSEIGPDKTTVSADFELPKNCVNISGAKTATIRFDLANYETKTFAVKNFVVRNAAKGSKVTVDTREMQVEIVGPSIRLSSLKASDIDIEIDMTGMEKETGSLQVPATVQLDSKFGSWALGSYTVYVSVAQS